jgi:hypothetical protein
MQRKTGDIKCWNYNRWITKQGILCPFCGKDKKRSLKLVEAREDRFITLSISNCSGCGGFSSENRHQIQGVTQDAIQRREDIVPAFTSGVFERAIACVGCRAGPGAEARPMTL